MYLNKYSMSFHKKYKITGSKILIHTKINQYKTSNKN